MSYTTLNGRHSHPTCVMCAETSTSPTTTSICKPPSANWRKGQLPQRIGEAAVRQVLIEAGQALLDAMLAQERVGDVA